MTQTLSSVGLGGSVLLGRATDCDVRFCGPDISRRHARIEFRRGCVWCIMDLGSLNGTFVNDERLDEAAWALVDGDVIRLGDSVCLVWEDPKEARAAAA